eukprot:symbB.v1.2.006163.t1/scaffold366.1/size218977/5
MPPVAVDRLRREIDFLLGCNDHKTTKQGRFVEKLEEVLLLPEGALNSDKELIGELIREHMDGGVKEGPDGLDAEGVSPPSKVKIDDTDAKR